MLTNFHTHTKYCDGKNSPREIIELAIELGYRAIGFSAHAYTPYDDRYCLKDFTAYKSEINALKREFQGKIEIYLGLEEDSYAKVNRDELDYIIGSSHYFKVNDKYYPIDSSKECFLKCLELFNGNAIKMAETYYESFVEYILERKPDIIGHFDLITKYDEIMPSIFLEDKNYLELSNNYVKRALKSNSIFEVNVGAIIRNYRTKPYPYENLLYTIYKEGGKIILSLDCHSVDALKFDFSPIIKTLKGFGFDGVYTIKEGKFIKEKI